MNPLHKEFAKEYLETGNGTQSVLEVFPDISSEEYAAVKANRLLRNDKVREYIESRAEKAAAKMEQLMSAQSEQVQFNATKDILDRAGYKPVEQSEIKQELSGSVSLESKEKIDGALDKIL